MKSCKTTRFGNSQSGDCREPKNRAGLKGYPQKGFHERSTFPNFRAFHTVVSKRNFQNRPDHGYRFLWKPFFRSTLSTAGNSTMSSERPSPEPFLKKEASSAVLRGRIVEMPGQSQMPWIIGLGGISAVLSRGIPGNSVRAFPGSFRKFLQKVPAVLSVWPTFGPCSERRRIRPLSRHSRHTGDFRDSRDSPSEKTPSVMTRLCRSRLCRTSLTRKVFHCSECQITHQPSSQKQSRVKKKDRGI